MSWKKHGFGIRHILIWIPGQLLAIWWLSQNTAPFQDSFCLICVIAVENRNHLTGLVWKWNKRRRVKCLHRRSWYGRGTGDTREFKWFIKVTANYHDSQQLCDLYDRGSDLLTSSRGLFPLETGVFVSLNRISLSREGQWDTGSDSEKIRWLLPFSLLAITTVITITTKPAPFPIPLQKERGFGLLLFVKHLLNANNLVGPVLRTWRVSSPLILTVSNPL